MTTMQMFRLLAYPKPGVVLYAVNLRNAGWGITWHENDRVPQEIPASKCDDWLLGSHCRHRGFHVTRCRHTDDWKKGLVVYAYYSTFAKMVRAEYRRLFERKS